jgi:hypothetical protein
MAKVNSNFLSSFIESFTRTSQAKQEQGLQAQTRKLQTKLFEKQLEQMDMQKTAQDKLGQMQSGIGETGPVQQKSLLDILADPMGEKLLMQAGTKPETVMNMKAYSQMLGGDKSIPEGFELQGVKYDTKGRPMYDYGKSKLDEPISPAASAEWVDSSGRSAPPGMTMRELQDGGYTPKGQNIDPTAAARITSMDIAVQSAGDVIGRIAPGGKLDTALLLQMNAPGGGIGEGRDLYLMMRDAIGSKVYAETGVTARPDELKSVLERFLPRPQDLTSEGLAVKKLERFQEFMQRTLDTATLPESVRAKLKSVKKTTQDETKNEKVIDFSELPD